MQSDKLSYDEALSELMEDYRNDKNKMKLPNERKVIAVPEKVVREMEAKLTQYLQGKQKITRGNLEALLPSIKRARATGVDVTHTNDNLSHE